MKTPSAPRTAASQEKLTPPASDSSKPATAKAADSKPDSTVTPPTKHSIGEALAVANPDVAILAEGILPLFLTSMTQELFKIKTGEDLTAEKPIKIIPKADLMADIQARLAISDFQPAKAQILEYAGDELVICFDPEYKYGQNFFLCISPAVAESILNPRVVESAGEEVPQKAKKPLPKVWESLGTDKEMEAEAVSNSRSLVYLKVSQRRRDFGSPYAFTDRDTADGFLELRSFKDPAFEINRSELATAVQVPAADSEAVPDLKNSSAQTTWFRPVNFACQYEPILFTPEEQNIILGSEEIVEFISSVSSRFEKALQQNAIIDIFVDDYQALGDEDLTLEQGSHTYLQEYQSFTDLMHSKDKSISCVDWHPTQRGVVAVSCVQRCTFDERIENGHSFRSKQSLILIWSFHDPIHPQLILEAPDDINCFQFNPSDPNIIAGGCMDGQVVVWDISEYQDKLKSNRKPRTPEDRLGANL
ncbi:WD repeat-containing protein 63, partial [Irineochytrium annulatum]